MFSLIICRTHLSSYKYVLRVGMEIIEIVTYVRVYCSICISLYSVHHVSQLGDISL